MKKTKKVTFFAIFATFALLTTVIVPQIQAKEKPKTTVRPIEDFFENNFWVLGWADPDSLFALYPHSDLLWYGSNKFIQDHEYSGMILEKDLENGLLEVSIHLHVKDVFSDVYWMDPDLVWWPYAMVDCYVDYYYSTTLRYEGEAGEPIPSLGSILWGGLGEALFTNFLAIGEGVITEDMAPLGYTPGATGKVICHQLYINTNGQDKWVREKVSVKEIGN